MNTLTTLALGAAMLSVLIVMVLGIVAMIKGGEFNKKYGNKLMKMRVMLQGLTLLLLVFAFLNNQG